MPYDSTVAMTVYNVLCSMKGQATKLALFETARTAQHPTLQPDQFDRALDGLTSRKLVTVDADAVKGEDPENRIVTSRSLADTAKGERESGWAGWVVRDLSGGGNKLRTLESVLEEVRS